MNRREEQNDWLAKELRRENFHGCAEHQGNHVTTHIDEYTTRNQTSKVDKLYAQEQKEMDKILVAKQHNDMAEQLMYGIHKDDFDYGEYVDFAKGTTKTVKVKNFEKDYRKPKTYEENMSDKKKANLIAICIGIFLTAILPPIGMFYLIVTFKNLKNN